MVWVGITHMGYRCGHHAGQVWVMIALPATFKKPENMIFVSKLSELHLIS